MVDSKKAVTITQFAKDAKISRQAVFKLIQTGVIKNADRVGNIWLIHEDELEKYKKEKSERG